VRSRGLPSRRHPLHLLRRGGLRAPPRDDRRCGDDPAGVLRRGGANRDRGDRPTGRARARAAPAGAARRGAGVQTRRPVMTNLAMPGTGPERHALRVVRGVLLAALVLGLVGTGIELLLLEHFEDTPQLIPLGLIAAALIVLAWHGVQRGPAPVHALRALMA